MGGTLIKWQEWNDETFRAAQEQDKPILLDIGAVWCHWCHVMDEGIPGDPVHTGTYSDPDVARLVAERYIPVKVDNDRRPDINARYNMGGWPTTVFLTPTGEPLYGETYVTPKRMIGLLDYVAMYYNDNKGDIAQRLAEHERDNEEGLAAGAVPFDACAKIAASVVANFDSAYGGFGTEPKFPHTRALEFALERFTATGDTELATVVAKTLSAMAGGGTYDQYAGGFFRYSTTRDWRIPHYEKMLEDNTQLSALCFKAGVALGDETFTEIGHDVHNWLAKVMFDERSGCFAGSQDADKEDEYYGKPLDERAKMPTPYIDRTIYVGWNAYMVSSLAARYKVTAEVEALDKARRTYAFVARDVFPSHFHDAGKAQGTQYLIADINALIPAALDLYEVTGEAVYLYEAQCWGDYVLDHLTDPAGGFYDLVPSPDAIGALAKPKKEMNENADAALALVRLSCHSTDPKYRSGSEKAIASFGTAYERWSFYGAAYGRAVAALQAPDIDVVVVGDQAESLVRAVWATFLPTVRVHVRLPEDIGEYPEDAEGKALAYVCVGTSCQAPISDPATLRQTLLHLAAPLEG